MTTRPRIPGAEPTRAGRAALRLTLGVETDSDMTTVTDSVKENQS